MSQMRTQVLVDHVTIRDSEQNDSEEIQLESLGHCRNNHQSGAAFTDIALTVADVKRLNVPVSHTRIVPSRDPLTNKGPSSLKAMDVI